MAVPYRSAGHQPGAAAVAADPALIRDGKAWVPASAEGLLAVLQVLLRSSHLAGPDDLPALVSAAGEQLGAARAVLYLADYDQLLLVPLAPTGPAVAAAGTTEQRESSLAPLAV